jgi:hypothetical protein
MRHLTPSLRARPAAWAPSLLAAAALIAGSPPPARADAATDAGADPGPRKLSVFILDFRVDEGAPLNGATATDVVTARISKLPYFDFVSREEFAGLVQQVALKQALGVDDVDDLVAIGKEARADKLLFGTVGAVEQTFVCKLVLIDVGTGDVERRVVRVATAPQKDLIIQTLASLADGVLAYLLRQYAAEHIAARPRTWTTRPHPAAWPLFAAGLGVAAGTGLVHATEATDPGAGVIAGYAAGGALAATGLVLVLTRWGGDREERGAMLLPTGIGAAPGLVVTGRF